MVPTVIVCVDPTCTQGLVKPDIVFFGEDLPQRFYSLRLRDFSHCDLLIIMGTSLEVMGGFPLYMFFKRIFGAVIGAFDIPYSQKLLWGF